MKVTYVYHSCFTVEIDEVVLIFDYYKKELPDIINDTKRDIYFFASHTHSDHFNPEIFEYEGENVYYVLSYDIEDKISHRKMLEPYEKVKYSFIRYDTELTLTGRSGQVINIKTLKSNDRGVAFVVSSKGKTVYHSGDLNNWYFENLDKAKRNDIAARYLRELDKLADIHIDAAFLPLDYRIGDSYYLGPVQFMEKVDVEYIFPMHMWEKYEYIEAFKNIIGDKKINGKVLDVNKEGKCFDNI